MPRSGGQYVTVCLCNIRAYNSRNESYTKLNVMYSYTVAHITQRHHSEVSRSKVMRLQKALMQLMKCAL